MFPFYLLTIILAVNCLGLVLYKNFNELGQKINLWRMLCPQQLLGMHHHLAAILHIIKIQELSKKVLQAITIRPRQFKKYLDNCYNTCSFSYLSFLYMPINSHVCIKVSAIYNFKKQLEYQVPWSCNTLVHAIPVCAKLHDSAQPTLSKVFMY